MLLICQNTTMQVYEAWNRRYYAYEKRLAVCSGLSLVHEPLGAPVFVRLAYCIWLLYLTFKMWPEIAIGRSEAGCCWPGDEKCHLRPLPGECCVELVVIVKVSNSQLPLCTQVDRGERLWNKSKKRWLYERFCDCNRKLFSKQPNNWICCQRVVKKL